MKNILYILLVVSFAYMFSSCDGSEKRDFSLDGEWTIYLRTIECSGTSGVEVQAKNLERELQDRFNKKMKTHNFIYTFGEIDNTEEQTKEYTEDLFEINSATGIPSVSLTGSYKDVEGGIITYVRNLAVLNNWQSNLKIMDLNNEHVMFSQNLTGEDLETMLFVYFGASRKLEAGITGRMVTKAIKNKKD